MIANYNIETDAVIQALITEAKADRDVIGLVLLGSRAIGGVGPDSDYDAIFVVTDEAATRYEQTQLTPTRGTTVSPPINTTDIWNDCPSGMQIGKIESWYLPMFAECLVLYDRTGETTRLINELGRMPADHVQETVARWYGTYLNGVYRSLKAWHRGLELGGRMEAAETANYLLHLFYALEGRWRPYSSRLTFHLDKLLEPQGWQPGELQAILLDLIRTGNPKRQQALARRVIALLRERGFDQFFDEWIEKFDRALSWDFPEIT